MNFAFSFGGEVGEGANDPPLGCRFFAPPAPSTALNIGTCPATARLCSRFCSRCGLRLPLPSHRGSSLRWRGELCESDGADWSLFECWPSVSCFCAIAFCWCLRSRAARSPTCQYFKITQRTFDLHQALAPSVHQQPHRPPAPPKDLVFTLDHRQPGSICRFSYLTLERVVAVSF